MSLVELLARLDTVTLEQLVALFSRFIENEAKRKQNDKMGDRGQGAGGRGQGEGRAWLGRFFYSN